MVIRAFITHKIAESFSACQDRFGINADTKSIAVSDGMGSTWQQKIWAQLLVDEFAGSNDWLPDIDSIKPLCQKWREKVDAFIQHLKDTNAPKYLVNMNMRSLLEGRSAGATFVGIRFNEKTWSGSVLGDSCLIEWNRHEAKFYTSQNVESFDNFPDYFDSNVLKEGKGTPKLIDGVLADGNYLLLVSDPFSDFLLERCKQNSGMQYISELLEISSHEEFETLVARWRKEGMHNDDTTLVIVENDNSNDFIIDKKDDIDTFIEKEKEEERKARESVIKQDPHKENGVVMDSTVDTESVVEEILNSLFPKNVLNFFRVKKRNMGVESKKIRFVKRSVVKNALEKVLKKYVISKK